MRKDKAGASSYSACFPIFHGDVKRAGGEGTEGELSRLDFKSDFAPALRALCVDCRLFRNFAVFQIFGVCRISLELPFCVSLICA